MHSPVSERENGHSLWRFLGLTEQEVREKSDILSQV